MELKEIENKIRNEGNNILKFKNHLKKKCCFSDKLKSKYYKVILNLKTHKIKSLYKNYRATSAKIEFENNQVLNRNESSKKKNFKDFKDVFRFRDVLLKRRKVLNNFGVWTRKFEKLTI